MNDLSILLKANGRVAMMAFVGLLGAYATSGQILPGIV